MTDWQLVLFDYATLDPETRIVVQQEDKEFDRNMGDAGTSFIRACHNLKRIHETLRYKRPGFVDYCNSKPGFSHSTALKMLNVAEMFAETTNISIVSKEAIYLLAAPSTPGEARQEALNRLEAGETITNGTAKQIVEAHTAIAAAALDTNTPPRLAINAALEVLEEYHATGGYVTLDDGEQVEADESDTLLDATRAAYDERYARQSQHIQDSMAKKAYKNSSESNEWYTPRYLIDKAIAVMGGIDLDPATSETANQTVQAAHIYTIEDDALTRNWFGRVWINPPYGRDVDPFVEKLVNEYGKGSVKEALMLVAARTDTAWFRRLRPYPRCFLWGRIKFINGETGEISDPAGFPSMVVYMGAGLVRFAEVFEDIGDIYIRWQ